MRTRPILCCLLVILAGCPAQGTQYVEVAIEDTSDESINSQVSFTGQFRVYDEPDIAAFEMEDVRVIFEDGSGVELRTVQVGTVSDTGFRQNISVRLDEPPDRVRIKTGSIHFDTGGINTEGTVVIYGLERTGNGSYEHFEQEE